MPRKEAGPSYWDCIMPARLVSIILSAGASGLTDLHALWRLTSLRVLELSQTDVNDSGLQHLAAMSQLTELSLYHTEITGDALRRLAPLKGLDSLYVSNTKFLHHGLGHIKVAGESSSPHLWISRQCNEPSFVLLSVSLCLAAPLSPRRVHALSTKLSDRDVRAIMVFLGRRLQELKLGTPVIEGIACLR